jgi:hypothetical protein
LLLFLRENPIGDVTRALGLAKGTVHRLRHGYWPADPRKILQAWGRHKASRSVVGSSWFMRRVRPGGLVRHAGADFTAPRLAARTGAFLAVTRTADGSLLAQTLELPSQRLPLCLCLCLIPPARPSRPPPVPNRWKKSSNRSAPEQRPRHLPPPSPYRPRYPRQRQR